MCVPVRCAQAVCCMWTDGQTDAERKKGGRENDGEISGPFILSRYYIRENGRGGYYIHTAVRPSPYGPPSPCGSDRIGSTRSNRPPTMYKYALLPSTTQGAAPVAEQTLPEARMAAWQQSSPVRPAPLSAQPLPPHSPQPPCAVDDATRGRFVGAGSIFLVQGRVLHVCVYLFIVYIYMYTPRDKKAFYSELTDANKSRVIST